MHPSKEDLHAAELCLVIRVANYMRAGLVLKGKSRTTELGKLLGAVYPGDSITVKIIAYAHGAVDGDRKFGIEVGFFGCNGAPNLKKLFL